MTIIFNVPYYDKDVYYRSHEELPSEVTIKFTDREADFIVKFDMRRTDPMPYLYRLFPKPCPAPAQQ